MEIEPSSLTINDLPDEILLMIFQKLFNIDVLYSLFGVNKRFTRIVRDRFFTKRLSFVQQIGKDLYRYLNSNEMLDRFCSTVLPSITDHTNHFDLESSLIEEIFHGTAHYPNLFSLGLYNLTDDTTRSLFTEKSFSSTIFDNQIKRLQLVVDDKSDDFDDLFSPMFIVCRNLFHIFP